MARSSCPACSAKLAKHAAYCSSCGQAIGVDLDLSALDDDDELPGLDGTEPVPSLRSPRTRNLLLGIGVTVALIGGAILVSRDDAETTATTDANTTTSSSEPRRSPRTTRVTLPRPTTSVYLELVPNGPLLPAPSNTVLYGTTSDGRLARIDLDTGEISLRRLPEVTSGDAVMQLIPRSGSIVAVGFPGTHSYVVPLGLQGEILALPMQDEQLFRGPAPDELWRVSSAFSPSATVQRVQLMKTDGSSVGPVQELALQVHLEDGAGRLIARGPGGWYVFAPEDGRPSLLSDGEMVSVDALRIVDLVCDDGLTCRWRVRDRAGGEGRLLETPPNPGELYFGGGGVASPDGRWAAFDDGGGRLQLLDLQSGAMSRIGSVGGGFYYGGATWSADSSWLFWSENGSLRAWQPGAADPMRIGGGSTPSLHALVAVPADG